MSFESVCRDIKEVKIQGARNVAKAALGAYYLNPTRKAKIKLISLRPTEPMLVNVLNMADRFPKNFIIKHFDEAQNKINGFLMKIIQSRMKILTHCHSTNVVNALIYAKKHGKNFEVFNTETRPLFQGRKTASELSKAKIKVTMIVDDAVGDALENGGALEKVDAFIIGADALLKNGDVINKIGSNMFAELAYDNKVPVYIIADSWKFSRRPVKIEERQYQEIWKNAPKHVKIRNPAFEKIKAKYITSIISELGILKPRDFVKKVKKR
jgi:translation initiation factor 2B subunit (eIF-2B alpha/beta/delta family)